MADGPLLSAAPTAEALGTFALVFAGCGAIVTDARSDGARRSRGHRAGVLPRAAGCDRRARSRLGRALQSRCQPQLLLDTPPAARDLGAYVTAQVLGATVAALALLVVWPGHPADLGATQPNIAVGRALLVELVLTAFLMLVIMSVATDTRAVGAPAALAIAAAVGLAAIAFGPLTGRIAEQRPFVRPGAGLGPVGGLLDLPRRATVGCAHRGAGLRVRTGREARTRTPR